MGALGRQTVRRRVPLRFSLRVMGEPVEVVTEAPPERARLDELLPAFRALDDAVVERSIAAAEADGERISCAKGCAACCKQQPVPVTPPEAFALARLVDRLPEPRRSAVRARFAEATVRLKAAGVYQVYMERDPGMGGDDAVAVTRTYMSLKLHCPFLVDDACGIYADRPFVCRQYLVSTPPEMCDNPMLAPVRRVRMPIGMAGAVLDATETVTGRPEHTVPLVLALDYAASRRAELGRRHDARAVIGDVLRHVAAG